ncbi:MAG TPA: selenocysteine-specific translation elongation factor [Phycisphaerae bacterium]|nr:selenocysteine-specific translation elongation factor [Phycisphaerae bacterium]HRY67201.1 selenocysteine-specific translation elongation factor [Phycisphaerae bacterium]HSA26429.1 selenocysteine-specific translation elongation factor [Phycisphaerae bacterium]
MERINITLGTAGHIDHGKTALVKNLTGCDTDRLKEEKERGMSIELGFAPCTVAGTQVGIVDVPGHENFIKTMVAGASGIDGVIFVIAADDGIMPQTREHFDILTLLGTQAGVVALTKLDRVPAERAERLRAEIRDFLGGTFLANAPVVGVSNLNGDGFGELVTALQDLVAGLRRKPTDGVFRMPIERTFSIKGFGTVVSGIPVSGTARIGDEVTLLPQGLSGRISAIQVYQHTGDAAVAGQCVALNVRQWDHHAIDRGCTVAVPGFFEAQQWFFCRLRLLPHERAPLKNASQVKLHTGTSEVMATVYLLDSERMKAGEHGLVQVRSSRPLVAAPGDRFILRSLSPVQTIGGGTIIEGVSQRARRGRPELLQDLAERAQAVGDENRFVEYCIRRATDHSATEAELARRAKVPLFRLQAILADLAKGGSVLRLTSGRYAHCHTTAELSRRLASLLDDFHRRAPERPGPDADELHGLTGWSRELFKDMVELSLAAGTLVRRNQSLALAGHREQFTDDQRRLIDKIETLFLERLFSPPESEELARLTGAAIDQVAPAIRILLQQNRLTRVGPDMIFHPRAVEKARQILVDFIHDEGRLESVRFKYLLDTTRKYALPLLDYFDRTGLTRRVNNTRYLRAGVNG